MQEPSFVSTITFHIATKGTKGIFFFLYELQYNPKSVHFILLYDFFTL